MRNGEMLESKKMRYKDLAPNENIVNGDEYFEALNYGIKNKKVYNIAITGPYGAGKSSVINTYLNKYPEIHDKSLRISLSTFEGVDKCDKEEIKTEILKQLFYKVDAGKIPDSRYRKIYKKYTKNFLWTAFLIEAVIVLVFYLFFPAVYKNIYGILLKLNQLSTKLVIPFCLSVFVFGWLSIAEILQKFSGKITLKHVETGQGSADFDRDEKESIFNKNVDEILYFFESTNYRVVFIEDVDRFEDCISIFTGLREINNLINSYDNIKEKVTFIYALRDDVFEHGISRAKFFELIIPIIPYINSTNSDQILHDNLGFEIYKDGSLKSPIYDISSRYLTLVSPYIADMRLLTNICNEFLIYKAILQGNQNLQLKDTQFFSLIIFKNLYPRDFAKLEEEKGIVKKAFEDKREFIVSAIQKFDEEIDQYQNEMKKTNSDILCNQTELKYLMLGCFAQERTDFCFNSIDIGDKNYSKNEFINNFNIEEIFNKKIVVYSRYGNALEISNINNYFEKYSMEFTERCKRLAKGKEEYTNNIKNIIAKIEKEKSKLWTMSMQELLNMYEVENVLSEEVKSNDLLVFMLRHGFINEHYSDYINYFHPNTISKDEMNFVLGVRNHNWKEPYNYSIQNREAVFEKLDIQEFNQIEILNFDVIDYVLVNNNCIEAKKQLLKLLAQYTKETGNFIKQYLERGITPEKLVEGLLLENDFFWRFVNSDTGITSNMRDRYFCLMLLTKNVKLFIKQDIEDETGQHILKKYIDENIFAQECLYSLENKVTKTIIEELNIKFHKLEFKNASKEIVSFIISGKYYELTKENIEKVVCYGTEISKEEACSAIIQAVLRTNNDKIISYVESDLKRIVTDYVLNDVQNNQENLNSINYIINSLITDDAELCYKIIKKMGLQWLHINECGQQITDDVICKKLWDTLLANRYVEINWNNYRIYYSRYGLQSELISFVAKNIDELLDQDFAFEVDEFEDLISSDIPIDVFEKLIQNYHYDKFNEKLLDLNNKKTEVMIRQGYIPFSVSYINILENKSIDLAFDYCLYNFEKIKLEIDNLQLSNELLTQLLCSEKIHVDDKKLLIVTINANIIDYQLALALRELQFELPKNIVDICWEKLDLDKKYELLLNQLEIYKNDELSILFGQLDEVYKQLATRTLHKYIFVKNDYNKNLLKKLLKKGYITSMKEEIERTHYGETEMLTGMVKKK